MAKVIITQRHNESTEIAISGELNIYCVGDVFQQYFQQIELEKLTLIKLEDISEIDTAGMQLLIMLLKIINEQNSRYQILSLGSPLIDYCNLFQLNRYFVDFKAINVIAAMNKEA
jgi:anti-anti-sigma factor